MGRKRKSEPTDDDVRQLLARLEAGEDHGLRPIVRQLGKIQTAVRSGKIDAVVLYRLQKIAENLPTIHAACRGPDRELEKVAYALVVEAIPQLFADVGHTLKVDTSPLVAKVRQWDAELNGRMYEVTPAEVAIYRLRAAAPPLVHKERKRSGPTAKRDPKADWIFEQWEEFRSLDAKGEIKAIRGLRKGSVERFHAWGLKAYPNRWPKGDAETRELQERGRKQSANGGIDG